MKILLRLTLRVECDVCWDFVENRAQEIVAIPDLAVLIAFDIQELAERFPVGRVFVVPDCEEFVLEVQEEVAEFLRRSS